MDQIVIPRLDAIVVPSDVDTESSLESFHRLVDARPKTRDAGGVVFVEVIDRLPIRTVVLPEDLLPNIESRFTSLLHSTVN